MIPRDAAIKPNARHAGQTLGQVIRSALGVSWEAAKKLVRGRHVHVDGNLCLDDARRLRGSEHIKVFAEARGKPVDSSSIDIVFKDSSIVVVNKPAGVTSNREPRERNTSVRRRQLQPTFDELLQQKLFGPPVKSRGRFVPKGPRVRPVHRLDRDTSGLMVFALTPDAERKLVAAFREHSIERKYHAVVRGIVEQEMTIESILIRDRGDGLRGSAKPGETPEDGQRALTRVRPVEVIAGKFTLVECELETGRTHQIRIHLCEAGHPLCGEKMYTHRPGERPTPDESRAPRQALHAAILGLKHPVTGRPMRFERDWPGDLKGWLMRLRRGASQNPDGSK